MSYSNSFPTQRPSLNLDFANSGKLDSRISFSRTDTPATYAAPSAVHYWSNEKHLSSENTQTNSDTLGSATDYAATLSSGGQVGPDGSATNASLLTGGAGTALKGFFFGTSAILQTVSFFAKEGTHRYIQLSVEGDSTKFVNFDLNGAGAKAANGSGVTASVNASGNGYLRCAVNLTVPSAGNVYITLQDSLGAGRENQTSSTGTVYFHGLQTTTLGDATNVAVYNATTTQIHRSYSSTLKSVTNSGDPRFEFNPITGNSEGLLIEQQSTNLTVSSQQVENWTPQEATVQPNVGIAPDSSLGADKLTESTTAASTHWIYKSTALGVSVGSTVYTVSFYAKAAGRTKFQSYDNNQTAGGNIYVDLTNGSITSGAGKVESVGNGWYRISYQAVADNSTTSTVRILMLDSGGSGSYDGDGFSGILLWGMQVEIGSAPTSYIKTATSATATRAADFCSVSTSEISGFSDTEGTLVAEGSYNDTSASSTAVTAQNAAHTEFAKIYLSTNQQVYSYVRGSGADQAYISAGSVTNAFKSAMRYDENNVGISLNGGTAVTDTSATMPIGMTTFYIGRSSKTWDVLNGNLKRVAYYSAPLSDTELQSLTS